MAFRCLCGPRGGVDDWARPCFNIGNTEPRRSPAGEALNDVLNQVLRLTRLFTNAGEALASPEGQTLARWVVLAECKEAPATVSEIARRLHLARQSVRRVAEALVHDGLCSYRANPRHQRASLLELTPLGRSVLERIEAAQRLWSDALGAHIGGDSLQRAREALAPVISAMESAGAPVANGRR